MPHTKNELVAATLAAGLLSPVPVSAGIPREPVSSMVLHAVDLYEALLAELTSRTPQQSQSTPSPHDDARALMLARTVVQAAGLQPDPQTVARLQTAILAEITRAATDPR